MADKLKIINKIAKIKSVSDIIRLEGFDWFIPFMNEMKKDGAVVIFKMDGEREKKHYTIIISGAELTKIDKYVRFELDSMEECLTSALIEYSSLIWKVE